MKKILLTFTIALFFATLSKAQIGINKSNPSATLDIAGDVKLEESLYLEDPGEFTTIRGSKLLINTTGDEVVEYDILLSKYGPINYAEFVFANLSKDGLQDYDTKIPIDDYIVTIQGYYFLGAGTSNTNVMAHSTITDTNIEGYQIYAYKNTTTGTWFIRGFVNNAEFMVADPSYHYYPAPIDLYLNVIIYRDGFITKSISPISIDMGNASTGIAPLPTGF